MTWQRIDDDTYIDDSLVTCAEYQLFIDEMREKGEYYQPDHWLSFQFPKGMAKEPVLGVRHSDAVAFCEWLTEGKSKEWNYNLPTEEEANASPLVNLGNRPFGYWTRELDNYDHFLWDCPANYQTKLFGLQSINLELIEFDVEIINMLNQVFAQGQVHPIDVSYFLKYSRNLLNNLDLAREDERMRIYVFSDTNRLKSIERAYDRAQDLILALERKNTKILAKEINFNIIADRIVDLIKALSLIDNSFETPKYRLCEMLINFITLRERIAGRSPAFEGIRLVKERIK